MPEYWVCPRCGRLSATAFPANHLPLSTSHRAASHRSRTCGARPAPFVAAESPRRILVQPPRVPERPPAQGRPFPLPRARPAGDEE